MPILLKTKFSYQIVKYFTCLMPIIFCFFVFLTGNVNYDDLFELRKYSATSKYWLGNLDQEYSVGRLPIYPMFIFIVYKIFGVDNYNALIFFQAILGFFSFLYLIKILEELNLSKNLIILATIFMNFSMIFRFSIFLPNCFFIFFLIISVYFLTKFFKSNQINHFIIFCLIFAILLLTRPIFQFTIFLTIPLIIFYIFKSKVSFKFIMILSLLASYISGMGIQILRNYNFDKSILYTSQSGHHFMWVVACLSKKYACGSRDMEVFNYISNKSEEEILKSTNKSLEQQNKIRINVTREYILENFSFNQFIFSVFFSYLKVIFHSSLIEVYGAFDLKVSALYSSGENNFLGKLKNIINSALSDPLILFWLISIFTITILRAIQIYGMVVGLKDQKKRIYVAIISSMVFLMLITTVGIGNPRYRSEMEPLLIILGAIGIDKLYKKLSKKKF
jgi:hypothetical protein